MTRGLGDDLHIPGALQNHPIWKKENQKLTRKDEKGEEEWGRIGELEKPRDGRKDWYGGVCLSSQLLKMPRQKDCKFKVILSYIGSPCLKVKVGCTSWIEHLLIMLKNLDSVPTQ